MLKLLMMFVGLANAQAVNLNKYLVLATPALAQARAQQQCQVLQCDGVFTKFWWNVVTLTDGTGAVEIQPSGFYGATTIVIGPCAVGCGLTIAEQSALKTAVQLGSLLPPPPQ